MSYYSSKLWGAKKVWNMEAFIAPSNFDADAQPLNIVKVFGEYNNVNKAYIYSFTSAISTLTLSASSGISYRWGETISGVDYVYDIASGTAFTVGSTKRYVIVNSTETSLVAVVPSGGIWLYTSEKIYLIKSLVYSNNYFKYIHCQNLHSLTTIGTVAFYNCAGLTGTLTIPNSVTTIGNSAFYNCKNLSGIGLINGNPTIGTLAFNSDVLITEWHIISPIAPSVQTNTWSNYAKPLHVSIGATGYDIAPWTNTAIFSSIIYDL